MRQKSASICRDGFNGGHYGGLAINTHPRATQGGAAGPPRRPDIAIVSGGGGGGRMPCCPRVLQHADPEVASVTPIVGGSAGASPMATFLQVSAAFLVAGFGNVGAGLVLDYVKEWPVFTHVDELFILVPSLLGLKGNLELTMAARLSTQANLGHMDNPHELLKMAKGNLALLQCQATVISFSVAIFTCLVKSMMVSVGVGSGGGAAAGSGSPVDQLDLPLVPHTLMAGGMLSGNSTSIFDEMIANMVGAQSNDNNNNNHTTTGASTMTLTSSNDIAQQAHLRQQQQQLIEVEQAPAAGFDWDHALVLCASSLLTANIASFVLGTMMIMVIVGSHKISIDPDNVASPVAASFGDMTTAALLAVIAHSIYHYSQQHMPYLPHIVTLLFLGMLPVWICVAKTNPYTASVLTKGWTPIVIAVFISACGGFILEHGKSRFARLPVFQPVINGVGGNLVAVQASRLSTSLHKNAKFGQLPPNVKLLTSPWKIFIANTQGEINLKTARILLVISIPAHLLYFTVIHLIEANEESTNQMLASSSSLPQVTWQFLTLYMFFAVLQVAILLYLAQNLVSLLWKCSIDPDNYSTPLLTATGDLLGCAFLFIVFVLAYQLSDPYALTVI